VLVVELRVFLRRAKSSCDDRIILDNQRCRWDARYADCMLAQIFQSTACNAIHSIEQRTAKWIISAMADNQAAERV